MSNQFQLTRKELVQIANYLKDKKIIVADSSNSCRSNISKALVQIGARTANIVGAKTLEGAKSEFEKNSASMIITDYNLGNEFGLDLVELHKKVYPSPQDRLFIVATSNSVESAVAEAAEEDVDAYILKPFTGHVIEDYLGQAIKRKIYPSAYQKEIHKGREHLQLKQFTDALKRFDHARTLEEKPSLACYYLGLVAECLNKFADAKTLYDEGLIYNDVHYKCMVGNFEVLQKLDRKTESYEVIQKLVTKFPVSPQRLGTVFQLAVYTKNYPDMEKYYELFLSLDRKTGILSRTVVAGLVVCGKFLLQQGDAPRACSAMKKAAVSSGRNPAFLGQIIKYLIDFKKYHDAESFLGMFPPSEKATTTYKVLNFFVFDGIGSPTEVAARGRQLIQDGVEDSELYFRVIDRFKELEKTDMAEALAYRGVETFPEERESFLKLIN